MAGRETAAGAGSAVGRAVGKGETHSTADIVLVRSAQSIITCLAPVKMGAAWGRGGVTGRTAAGDGAVVRLRTGYSDIM